MKRDFPILYCKHCMKLCGTFWHKCLKINQHKSDFITEIGQKTNQKCRSAYLAFREEMFHRFVQQTLLLKLVAKLPMSIVCTLNPQSRDPAHFSKGGTPVFRYIPCGADRASGNRHELTSINCRCIIYPHLPTKIITSANAVKAASCFAPTSNFILPTQSKRKPTPFPLGPNPSWRLSRGYE